MADFVATIHVPAGHTVWPADEVPHLTAGALYRFEPEPDPVVTRAELRRFTSADLTNRAAGRALNGRELSQFASKCKAAGLPELTDGLRYRQWGEYLEAFNQDAEARGWWAGLIPPRDPHLAERLALVIAAEEHRKLLKVAIAGGEIQARMAGTLVPARAGIVNLQQLVLTREGLNAFAARLAMRVVSEPDDERDSVNQQPARDRGVPVKPTQAQPAQEAEVLRVLRELGHEPTKLPPRAPGRPWVKSEAWAAIGRSQLFASEGVFKKAWERLRAKGEIAERPGL